MICFYCGKQIDIEKGDRYAIIPLDRPYYVNIPFCQPECMQLVNSYGWEKYIQENISRIGKLVDVTKRGPKKEVSRKMRNKKK